MNKGQSKLDIALKKKTERKFSGFVRRLKRDTAGVRRDVNSLPIVIYDAALSIFDGNRQDEAAVKVKFVFRSIEVNPDKNWERDMIRLEKKLNEFKGNKGLTPGTKLTQVKHPNVQNKSSVCQRQPEGRTRRSSPTF